MAEIILGSDTNPGGRKYNEDRCGTDSLVARSGRKLSVAIVCDGVGGEERGERAAQVAIDAFLAFLRESDIAETPRLLYQAVKAANVAAFQEATRLDAGERMACTLVAVVVEDAATAYIANVGDSRIYLLRDGVLKQISRDHTFANVQVWRGKLSPEAAAAHPDASKVMDVLGTRPDVTPDMGFYLTTVDYGEANRIGRQGLQLKQGDALLCCSDGLVKNTATTGQPLVFDKEIAQVLGTDEGPKAARGIMSIALGRIPVGEQVDNISLAIAQTEDPTRLVNASKLRKEAQAKQQAETNRKVALIAGLVAIPLCVLLLVALGALGVGYGFFNNTLSGTAAALANATQVAAAETATVAAYTPTPTPVPPTATPLPTSVPTLAAGEIAKIFKGEELVRPVFDDQKPLAAPPSQNWYVAVKHRQDQNGTGDIFMAGGSQMLFSAVTDSRFQLKVLSAGADMFFQTGPYNNGAQIELAGVSVLSTVKGCMAAYYPDPNTLLADCFGGQCAISINFGSDYTDVPVGHQAKLDIGKLHLSDEGAIPQPDIAKYFSLLSQTSAGRDDMQRCNVPNLSATATAVAVIQRANATAAAAAATRNAAAAAATQECQRLQGLGTPCP